MAELLSGLAEFLSNFIFMPVHALETTVSATESIDEATVTAGAAAALVPLMDIFNAITPFFKYAGILLLGFFVIKLMFSFINADDTTNKTQIFIMIAISIGLIYWEPLIGPIKDAVYNIAGITTTA